MDSSPIRNILGIAVNLLIAWAIAMTLRLGIEFFGQLASQGWGKAVVAFTGQLLIPFGVHAVKTPYGGVFDINAALMVAVLLVAEWVLSGVRDRA